MSIANIKNNPIKYSLTLLMPTLKIDYKTN